MAWQYISTIGQDSHAFKEGKGDFKIRLGGIDIPHDREISANSDGDVVLHAVTNAISGFTTIPVLGAKADTLCLEQGIKDSRVYLMEALKDLKEKNGQIVHLSMTIECKRPKLLPHLEAMRLSLSSLLDISSDHIAVTATTGEGLTAFGRGEGIQVFAILTVRLPEPSV